MLVWQSLSLRAEAGDLPRALRKIAGGTRGYPVSTRVISRACGLIALALGFAVLLGWAFDVTTLKSVLPGLFAMQPWAAITIALAGGPAVAAAPGRIAPATSIALAGMVLIIGLEMVLQHATGRLRHRSMVLPGSRGQSAGPSSPGPGRRGHVDRLRLAWCDASARSRRESLGTSGFLHHRHRRAAPDGRAATRLPHRRRYLQSAAFFTPIALHAALGLVVLFLGALALRPNTGWMALLSGDMPGATSARMLLPVAVAGPVLLAWLFTSGKQAGLYGPDFQVGLITLATIALLGNALLWNAARLDRLHRARLAAAEALRQSEERYRSLVEAQPDPICQFCRTRRSPSSTGAYERSRPEELDRRRWLDFAPRDERPRFLEELTSRPEHPERHEETRSTRAGPGGALVPVSPLRLLR